MSNGSGRVWLGCSLPRVTGKDADREMYKGTFSNWNQYIEAHRNASRRLEDRRAERCDEMRKAYEAAVHTETERQAQQSLPKPAPPWEQATQSKTQSQSKPKTSEWKTSPTAPAPQSKSKETEPKEQQKGTENPQTGQPAQGQPKKKPDASKSTDKKSTSWEPLEYYGESAVKEKEDWELEIYVEPTEDIWSPAPRSQASTEDPDKVLDAHLHHLYDLALSGNLDSFAALPACDCAFLILQAASLQAAETLVASDPLVTNGYFGRYRVVEVDVTNTIDDVSGAGSLIAEPLLIGSGVLGWRHMRSDWEMYFKAKGLKTSNAAGPVAATGKGPHYLVMFEDWFVPSSSPAETGGGPKMVEVSRHDLVMRYTEPHPADEAEMAPVERFKLISEVDYESTPLVQPTPTSGDALITQGASGPNWGKVGTGVLGAEQFLGRWNTYLNNTQKYGLTGSIQQTPGGIGQVCLAVLHGRKDALLSSSPNLAGDHIGYMFNSASAGNLDSIGNFDGGRALRIVVAGQGQSSFDLVASDPALTEGYYDQVKIASVLA